MELNNIQIQISDYEAFRVYRSMSAIYNWSVEDVRSYFHSNSYATDGVQACDMDGHALLLVFFDQNAKEDFCAPAQALRRIFVIKIMFFTGRKRECTRI